MKRAKCINCKHLILDPTDYARYRLTGDKTIEIKYNCEGGVLYIYDSDYHEIEGWKTEIRNNKHVMNEKYCNYEKRDDNDR